MPRKIGAYRTKFTGISVGPNEFRIPAFMPSNQVNKLALKIFFIKYGSGGTGKSNDRPISLLSTRILLTIKSERIKKNMKIYRFFIKLYNNLLYLERSPI